MIMNSLLNKGFISKHIIDEIERKIDIVSVIGRYVALHKRGGKYWGLSPFKVEKTPSFTVDPVKKLYYCFSTQQGGNVFTFIKSVENVNFVNAVHILAKEAGVVIPDVQYSSTGKDQDENSIYERALKILSYISEQSVAMLSHDPQAYTVREYLHRRNIHQDSIQRFRLGYVPSKRDWAYQLLKQKGFSDHEMASSGLFSKKSPQYCLFTQRLVFPIMKLYGQVVGFGGRLLEGEGPKYLNSPQSSFFEKKQMVYGLYEATQGKYNFEKLYVVEGYFDVIAMHQAGITNTVAPLGTAFTVEHARILRRFTDTIVLVFDNDEAGRQAALRAATICESIGFRAIRTVDLPKKDVADILQEYGEGGVRDEVLEDRDFFDYYIDRLLLGQNESQEYREKALLEISSYISGVSLGYRKEMYLAKVTQLFGVTKATLQGIMKYMLKQRGDGNSTHYEEQHDSTGVTQQKPSKKVPKTAELLFVAALSYNLTNYEVIRREIAADDLLDSNAKHVYLKIEELYRTDTLSFTELMEQIDQDVATAIRTLVFSGEVSRYANVLVTEFIDKHKILKYRHRSNEINRLLAIKEQQLVQQNALGDGNVLLMRKEMKELLEEKKYISTMLLHLSKNKGNGSNSNGGKTYSSV